MISHNHNNEQFCHQMDSSSILGEQRTENDYLSYESENSNRNNDNSYNLFPIFHLEEKENNIDEKEQNKLYFLEKEKPKKSFKKFESKKHLKKKRGRKKRKQKEINENEVNNYTKIHDKHTSDNVLRKIQVHYLTFIISFINEILYNLKLSQRFYKLSYSFKKNVKKEFVNSLNNKNIGEILCNKISNKYKKDVNINKNIYDKIKENKILKEIFSENYLSLFKKIYLKSTKSINLSEYGLNKNIILSDKVKMFKDLLNKIENLDTNKKYKKIINACIIQHFVPHSLFKIE